MTGTGSRKARAKAALPRTEERAPGSHTGQEAGLRTTRLEPPEFAPELWACISCNYCGAECPTAREAGWESTTPRGKIRLFQLLRSQWDRKGRVEVPGRFVEAMYECTSCGRCTEVCHVDFDFLAHHERWRRWLASSGCGPLPDHRVLLSSLRDHRNPYLAPRKDRARWAEGLGLPERGEVLFFAGCSDSYVHPEVARRSVEVLRALGHEVAYLGADEPCCGSTAARLGAEGDFEDLVHEVARRVEGSGARLVVTACPGCSSALREYYPQAGVRLAARVLHITELLDQDLRDGRLRPTRRLPGRYVYYDPCHLGRVDGVFEEPRRVLAACVEELVELPRGREESLCCGSGGGYKTAFPASAGRIGGRVVGMATDVGAGTLVTACPWCESNLGEAASACAVPPAGDGGSGRSLPVMDLVEVVAAALGLERAPGPSRVRPGRLSGGPS